MFIFRTLTSLKPVAPAEFLGKEVIVGDVDDEIPPFDMESLLGAVEGGKYLDIEVCTRGVGGPRLEILFGVMEIVSNCAFKLFVSSLLTSILAFIRFEGLGA